MGKIISIDQNQTDVQINVENVQIYPSRTRTELNDKATRKFFNFNAETYKQIFKGESFDVVEMEDHPKYGEIVTPCKIISPYEEPLNEFDRAILSVCTTEFISGNRYTTIPIIFRALVGKVGVVGAIPYKNQAAAIRRSVDKLLGTTIELDTQKSFTQLGYKFPKEKPYILKSTILPCCRAAVTINGQVTEIIYFDRVSPLWDIAEVKKQILHYDSSLLNVPRQNNTPMNIVLKNYVMRRVTEIVAHHMTPAVTFKDIFQKCRIENTNHKTKHDARESVIELFKHLKNCQYINNFDMQKKKNGGGLYGISFNYEIKRWCGRIGNFSDNKPNV